MEVVAKTVVLRLGKVKIVLTFDGEMIVHHHRYLLVDALSVSSCLRAPPPSLPTRRPCENPDVPCSVGEEEGDGDRLRLSKMEMAPAPDTVTL